MVRLQVEPGCEVFRSVFPVERGVWALTTQGRQRFRCSIFVKEFITLLFSINYYLSSRLERTFIISRIISVSLASLVTQMNSVILIAVSSLNCAVLQFIFFGGQRFLIMGLAKLTRVS